MRKPMSESIGLAWRTTLPLPDFSRGDETSTMKLLSGLWCALFLLAVPVAGRGEEHRDRGVISSTAFQAFIERRYADLERQAEGYRTTQARTSSGVWKLAIFDAGIGGAFTGKTQSLAIWESRRRNVEAWIAAYPKDPSPRLAQARMMIQRAWTHCGCGGPEDAAPAERKAFLVAMQNARIYLESQKKIAAVDPRWYEYMAEIAGYQRWPRAEFDRMLDEGLTRHPQYYDLYFKALAYYAPRSGGTAQAVDDFARAAVKRTRKTEGEGMYARIYWYAAQVQYHDELFRQSKVDWPTMKRGIHDVLARYPDAWNLNNFARFACLAGDREEAKALATRIGEIPDVDVWNRNRGEFPACRAGKPFPRALPGRVIPGRTAPKRR